MDVRVVRSSMSKSGKSLADDVEEIVRTIGERVLNEKQTPCIHGNLCREIYKLTGRIYSIRCPYGCKFYEPVKIAEKGDVE